ncbi:divisome protein SepX/GlpR [Amycolatopsis aidingensis]|uniref:divisome protein SepX/GlpR n=1 Tax=Amycolatopsis aidingensis TaxID=2842453 RepID=UPI001C0BF0F1|nr:gephyrin-like molybdotransferase receptor GlpR [Amycolatopsis aidingensis]
MPSSLIIVALAAAWLVVLVPMIARKRQEIARTNDSALAARVVRSGRGNGAFVSRREEFALSENAQSERDTPVEDEDTPGVAHYDAGDVDDPADLDEDFEDGFDADLDDDLEDLPDEEPMAPEEPARQRATGGSDRAAGAGRQYRPGRGGFDPEAAEIAARAKYAYRQRVVVALLLVAVVTGVLAGFLLPVLWWLHGAVDLVLVGYLVYLRRQVRIEEEIRQRRMARLNASGHAARPEPREAPASAPARPTPPRRDIPGVERKPMPTARTRQNAVVVDPDDEDPAFHELDEPGSVPFRRAAGE